MGTQVMQGCAPMSLTELDDALNYLHHAETRVGEIPEPIKKLLSDMLAERDNASARIARSLKGMVKT
jgi:hypothetical protein